DLGSTQRYWQLFQTNNSGNSPLSRKRVADPQGLMPRVHPGYGSSEPHGRECEDVTGHTPRCLRRPITKGTCALARQPRGCLELRKHFGQAIPILEFGSTVPNAHFDVVRQLPTRIRATRRAVIHRVCAITIPVCARRPARVLPKQADIPGSPGDNPPEPYTLRQQLGAVRTPIPRP